MRITTTILALLWATTAMVHGDDGSGVVISMRQYLIQGSSRIHLYLYSMDGTFKKALTDDPGFNDLDPVFSSDGKTIRFRREGADKAHEAKAGNYVVDIASGKIRAPQLTDDNSITVTCDHFTNAYGRDSQGWVNIDAGMYQTQDGKFKIKRKSTTGTEPGAYEVIAEGKEPVLMAGLPGFISVEESDPYDSPQICNNSPFVTDGAWMEVLFISHHLGSTDGDQIWGLDLTTMKGVKISQNGAGIYHPPSASGVYVISSALYQPLGNTGKTVNCSYLEWWDAHLKLTRFGPDLSVCCSAAIYGGDYYKNSVIP
jgi:hypothetical protein